MVMWACPAREELPGMRGTLRLVVLGDEDAGIRVQLADMTMARVLLWVVAFGRFWYRFIVGDDWRLAATVAVGLLITAILNASRLPAWWLVPALVIVAIGISLRRASRA